MKRINKRLSCRRISNGVRWYFQRLPIYNILSKRRACSINWSKKSRDYLYLWWYVNRSWIHSKIAAITTIIPKSVLGGAMLAMFGMVMAYGIKMLSSVDFGRQENLLIVACSVGIGLGVTVVPTLFSQLPESIRILTDNGIVLGSASAVLLNIVFNMVPQRKVKVKDEPVPMQSAEKRKIDKGSNRMRFEPLFLYSKPIRYCYETLLFFLSGIIFPYVPRRQMYSSGPY